MFLLRISVFIIFLSSNILFSQINIATDNISDENINNENIVSSNLEYNTSKETNIKNRHSLSLDLGPTLTSVGYLNIANLFIKQPDGVEKRMLSGTFGIGFNYHYMLVNKIHLEAHLGINTFLFYFYEGYYPPTPNLDFGVEKVGDVDKYFLSRFIDIPISFGARFYLSKKKNNSGFYITPKIGANMIFSIDKVETMRVTIEENADYKNEFLYKVSTNKTVANIGLFVSAEIGFRIDMNIKKLNDKGLKAFFDISIIDLGYYILPYYSKKYVFGEAGDIANTLGKYSPVLNIRAVPIPKIAFGVSF